MASLIVGNLKAQRLVNRRLCLWIIRFDAKLSAVFDIGRSIADIVKAVCVPIVEWEHH